MTTQVHPDHAQLANRFTADQERAHWHDGALWFVRQKRDRMARSLPEWERLRELAAQVKAHTLSNLPHYLEMFERNATRLGATVHWARDAEEHNRIVHDILQASSVKRVMIGSRRTGPSPAATPAPGTAPIRTPRSAIAAVAIRSAR